MTDKKTNEDLTGQVLPRVRTVDIDLLDPHPRNPRKHPDGQINKLRASYREFGQQKNIVVRRRTDRPGRYYILAGHGFTVAARAEYAVSLEAKVVPDEWSDAKAAAYIQADNMGGFEDEEMAIAELVEYARNSDVDIEAMGFTSDEFEAMLDRMGNEMLEADAAQSAIDAAVEAKEIKVKKPNPRILPLDVIYTLQGADCTCCLAVQAGLKYGINSSSFKICPYEEHLTGRHKVTFIDNDYFKYSHERHLSVVAQFKPKYATVRDIMTRDQCKEAGIEYYPLPQILDWAVELAEHAENVILIPKYDCIDQIPQHPKFMLGYSVPSSHGMTPLSVECFRGWRVHLLGGSWKAQLGYLAELGEDVVSLDNNQVALIADKFGQFVMPDGETRSIGEVASALNNVRYVCLSLTFGAIGAKLNELYATGAVVADASQVEDNENENEEGIAE